MAAAKADKCKACGAGIDASPKELRLLARDLHTMIHDMAKYVDHFAVQVSTMKVALQKSIKANQREVKREREGKSDGIQENG